MSVKKTDRIPEIELMKFVAIIGMILVHTLEGSWDSLEGTDTGTAQFIFWLVEFLGGIVSGGGFMLAMGWGAAFSDRATPASYVKRCFILVGLGALVNVFEVFLPGIIDPENFGPISDFYYGILAVDIYYFAAVLMLFFGLMKLMQGKDGSKIGISVCIVLVAILVNTFVPAEAYSTGNDWADTLIGLFIRENDYSWFPLVTWVIHPLAGYWLGNIYRKLNDRRGFIKLLLILGIPTFVLSEIMVTVKGLPHEVLNPGGYDEFYFYAMSTWSMIGGFGLLVLELALFMILREIFQFSLPQVVAYVSKNVIFIYVTQWLILGCLYPYLFHITNLWINLSIGLCVMFVVYLLCRLKDRVFREG